MDEKYLLDAIRFARQRKEYTQEDMAEMLFVDRKTYSNYELGKRKISYQTLCKIVRILNDEALWNIIRNDMGF